MFKFESIVCLLEGENCNFMVYCSLSWGVGGQLFKSVACLQLGAGGRPNRVGDCCAGTNWQESATLACNDVQCCTAGSS